jgi:hypothetical protein
LHTLNSKHALEDQNEEQSSIPSKTTFIAEHERLTAEYRNERALLKEALEKSQDASRNASDNESAEEVECASVPVKKEQSEKFPRLRMTEPLKPIPVNIKKAIPHSNKESNEDEVYVLNLFAFVQY